MRALRGSNARSPKLGSFSRRGAFAVVSALAGLTVIVAVASAAYINTGSVGGPGTGDGQFNTPLRAAVDNDSGNLYVADSGNDRIQIFEPDGPSVSYSDQFTHGSIDAPIGVAIDQSDGSIYVADADDVVKFDSSHNLDDTFTSPGITGPLAVDPNDNDLLIGDQASDTIKRFDADGSPDGASEIDGSSSPDGAFTGLQDIAVNSSGDIYVVDADGPIESGPSGTPSPTGTSRAERFGADGTHQATLTPVGPNQRPARVAVDTSTDIAYVSGEQDAIYRDAEATLHIFDASNNSIDAFELDQGPPYIRVGGLAVDPGPGKVYVVHDRAYWGNGLSYGSEPGVLVFRDLALVAPASTIEPASAITGKSATLNGTVDAGGLPIDTCSFRFVDDAQYQEDGFDSAASVDCEDSPSGADAPVSVSADVEGLQDDTLYHFRLEVEGLGGSGTSGEQNFTTLDLPSVLSGEATEIGRTTATLTGSVDPDGEPLTECLFEYGTDDSYGETVPCAEDPGSGDEPTDVSAEVTGLAEDTAYHFRLRAANAHGVVNGDDVSFKTTSLPIVAGGSAIDITASSVTLRGRVNPKRFSTTYQFEYGTDDSYGETIPLVPANAGDGDSLVNVSHFLDGLEPNTTYHFRLVATSSVGVGEGPDHTFTTLAERVEPERCANEELRAGKSADLPDCRAYELVTPPDKNGSDVYLDASLTSISTDGEAVRFDSSGIFADANGGSLTTTYLAKRAGGTWATHNIWPAVPSGSFASMLQSPSGYFWGIFSADLDRGLFMSSAKLPGTPEASHAAVNLYLRTGARSEAGGEFQLLTECDYDCSDIAFPNNSGLNVPDPRGASLDRSRVLIQTPFPLTSDSPSGTNVRKLFLAEGGELTYVAQIPPGDASSCGGDDVPCVPAPRATADGYVVGFDGGSMEKPALHNFLSEDGARIFFNVGEDNSFEAFSRGRIYQRDTYGTASTADDTTVKVNTSELVSPENPQDASLHYMTSDGEYAVFWTRERLTEATMPGNYGKLYRWSRSPDAEGSHLTLIGGRPAAGDSPAVNALYVVATSSDGEDIYFVGEDGLVPDDAPLGSLHVLYHWNVDSGLAYVARLPTTGGEFSQYGGLIDRDARSFDWDLSDDGSRLLFRSSAPPDASFDHGQCEQGDCAQIYLYDANGEEPLRCISCPQGGTAPTGSSALLTKSTGSAATYGREVGSPMTADGSTILFTTTQRLVAADINGPCERKEESGGSWIASCADVYLYDTETDRLSLISGGRDTSGSYFLDATPDGSTVLFASRERLVGTDVDGAYDLYVARVGGGLAAQNPAEPEVPCADSESCHGSVTTPPGAESVGSALDREGNPAAATHSDCSSLKRRAVRLRKRQGKLRARARQSSGKRAKKLRRKARRVKRKRTGAEERLVQCERGDS